MQQAKLKRLAREATTTNESRTGENRTRLYACPGRESLSEKFNNEIDAWARQALRANGFGG